MLFHWTICTLRTHSLWLKRLANLLCTFSKKLGVVGKGLLFDTGGYNIKTGMMELMKFDCGGSVSIIDKI